MEGGARVGEEEAGGPARLHSYTRRNMAGHAESSQEDMIRSVHQKYDRERTQNLKLGMLIF